MIRDLCGQSHYDIACIQVEIRVYKNNIAVVCHGFDIPWTLNRVIIRLRYPLGTVKEFAPYVRIQTRCGREQRGFQDSCFINEILVDLVIACSGMDHFMFHVGRTFERIFGRRKIQIDCFNSACGVDLAGFENTAPYICAQEHVIDQHYNDKNDRYYRKYDRFLQSVAAEDLFKRDFFLI